MHFRFVQQSTRVAAIPQIHFSGTADTVVPTEAAQRFVRAVQAAGGRCVQLQLAPGLGHDGDWAGRWRAMLAEAPSCPASSTAAP